MPSFQFRDSQHLGAGVSLYRESVATKYVTWSIEQYRFQRHSVGLHSRYNDLILTGFKIHKLLVMDKKKSA